MNARSPTLATEPLFEFDIDVGLPYAVPLNIGIIPLSGTVRDCSKARCFPEGPTFQTIDASGSLGIAARFVLERADGARVEVTHNKQLAASPEVLAALRGENTFPPPRTTSARTCAFMRERLISRSSITPSPSASVSAVSGACGSRCTGYFERARRTAQQGASRLLAGGTARFDEVPLPSGRVQPQSAAQLAFFERPTGLDPSRTRNN